MACRRCGCRMLTKVGRSTSMLICTDCGLPIDQRETAIHHRQRLWGALTLVAMASVGAAMLLLASMQEMRKPGLLEDASESQAEASSQDRENGAERVLSEPSSMKDLPHISSSRTPQPPAPAAAKLGAIQASAGTGPPQDRHH